MDVGLERAQATFFTTPAEFTAWLETHHNQSRELWVGFHKKGSGLPSITWPQTVDEALCFGWIDGVRRSLGETSYVIRFTPRKASSTKREETRSKRLGTLMDDSAAGRE
jgi:uncharacterized protein YdeI (YjbR/CyaY-like superfamily)